MPRLANRQYPKFEMKGFEFDWTAMEDENTNQLAGQRRSLCAKLSSRRAKIEGPIELPG